jgi:hypothetical protein
MPVLRNTPAVFPPLWKTGRTDPETCADLREPAGKAGQIRKDDPTYSAGKIHPVLLRAEDADPGVSTAGRLVSGGNLFFRAGAERCQNLLKKPMEGGGSGNMKSAQSYLASLNIPQY